MAFLIPKHALVSFLPFAPLPPVYAVSPLKAEQSSWELRHHPNPQDELRFGFKPGFSHVQSLKPACLSVSDEYLATEVSLGRVSGPFTSPPFPLFHVSSFGVIAKKG